MITPLWNEKVAMKMVVTTVDFSLIAESEIIKGVGRMTDITPVKIRVSLLLVEKAE